MHARVACAFQLMVAATCDRSKFLQHVYGVLSIRSHCNRFTLENSAVAGKKWNIFSCSQATNRACSIIYKLEPMYTIAMCIESRAKAYELLAICQMCANETAVECASINEMIC